MEKGQHDPWGAGVTEQMVAAKRVKAPDLRFWLARADGTDAAFFSSWPRRDGVGIVEDLFTRPEFRHRGIATALIAHSVADARERGAGLVAISARAADTPKLPQDRLTTSIATGNAVCAQPLSGLPSCQSWYLAASRRRARPSSSASVTIRARAAQSWSAIRSPTRGSARRFRTQSARSPPPERRYTVSPSAANQISIVWGCPLRRPVVVT